MFKKWLPPRGINILNRPACPSQRRHTEYNSKKNASYPGSDTPHIHSLIYERSTNQCSPFVLVPGYVLLLLVCTSTPYSDKTGRLDLNEGGPLASWQTWPIVDKYSQPQNWALNFLFRKKHFQYSDGGLICESQLAIPRRQAVNRMYGISISFVKLWCSCGVLSEYIALGLSWIDIIANGLQHRQQLRCIIIISIACMALVYMPVKSLYQMPGIFQLHKSESPDPRPDCHISGIQK